MLSEEKRDYLIELIEKGQKIPEEFKADLFPTLQSEYELSYAGKMRKEDLLANEDGTFPVPIQMERDFSKSSNQEPEDGWKNMIVFGDNLQFIKAIYENKDPIIKDKVKGKVKLIYIDPPFATQDEFQNRLGAKAYNDKKQGSEFLEFLRRRLILAREILANDGSIYVHMDQKMGHYVKIILDEVFGKNQFKNEIIWQYKSGGAGTKAFANKHDVIFYYTKGSQYTFNVQKEKSYNRDFKPYRFKGVEEFEDEMGWYTWVNMRDVWEINMVGRTSSERIDYPTQKPEALLRRIITTSTNEGDLILDFFGGSGTTMAVAEKLNRRWITCDLGKLSYFTMQKRLLQTENFRNFMTCTLGIYDLKHTLKLEWDRYQHFVSQIFEFELDSFDIGGLKFDGEKRGHPVKIFNYMEFQDSSIDETYINALHDILKDRNMERIYLVSPALKVNYIADYEEIDGTRYYFLKVPYEMISELHKKPFQKLRQPTSRNDINNIEEMKGFQFVYPPEVACRIEKEENDRYLVITDFKSHYLQYDSKGSAKEFETLSSIFFDYDYDGKEFVLDEAFFAEEVFSKKREMDFNNPVKIKLPEDKLGKTLMVIFSDVYGNDSTIKLEVRGKDHAG